MGPCDPRTVVYGTNHNVHTKWHQPNKQPNQSFREHKVIANCCGWMPGPGLARDTQLCQGCCLQVAVLVLLVALIAADVK